MEAFVEDLVDRENKARPQQHGRAADDRPIGRADNAVANPGFQPVGAVAHFFDVILHELVGEIDDAQVIRDWKSKPFATFAKSTALMFS